MKVTLDTNVLLSAFAARGLCESLLEACLHSHEVALSEHILDEFRRGLEDKLRYPAPAGKEAVAFLREACWIVVPAEVPTDACRDPSDLPVIGTAVAGQVDALVSGDKDLLDIGQHKGIPVLSPRAFYERLQ